MSEQIDRDRIDRDRAVRLLREEFMEVTRLCESLDHRHWDLPTCLPGWSVKDQLAHLIGTETMLAGGAAPEVEVPDAPHIKNEIGRMNERWVAALRPLSGAEVLERWREVTSDRLDQLERMTQEDFDAPSWTPAGPDQTYGRFMRIRFLDCFVHEHDIREAVGAPSRDDDAHLAFVLEEIASAVGYVVGKKASAPEGSRIRLTITGPAARRFDVRVSGRAQLVDSLDDEPDAEITVPSPLFVRLAAGREEAGPHIGSTIGISGDRELAVRVATNLAYMI
ncbi:MAG: hypothetical protein KatS3mg008_0962 [Acidimicrobiales bacterium]|nr:MAG: hypothetical protein KatS3mg008_0962 [Acidimicrobiales bacterium]